MTKKCFPFLCARLIGFGSRLLRDQNEKVVVVSSLQEISRNVDTFALLPAKKQPQHCFTEDENAQELEHVLNFYENHRFTVTDNKGSKTLLGACGADRIAEFANWLFDSKETIGKDTIIVAGHSLYFRNFIRTYLPADSNFIGKNKKIVNCGVVKFEFVKGSSGDFWIKEESIKEVYGGFEGSSMKKTQ